MSKPKILEILNEKQSQEKLEKTLDSERAWVTKQEKKKKLDLHIFLTSKQSDESLEEKAKNLMTYKESQIKSMNFIVQKEIDGQKKNILERLEDRKRAISFIEPAGDVLIAESKREEYKKNSLMLLKKGSKEIGSLVNMMQLRNSLKKSKSIKDEAENYKEIEIENIAKKYEKELLDLKKNLKDKEKSLLINKMIEKIESERDKAIEAIRKKK